MKDTYCPRCRKHLIINDNLETSRNIICMNCHLTFENPYYFKKNTFDKSNLSLTVKVIAIFFGVIFFISMFTHDKKSNGVSETEAEVIVTTYLKGYHLKDPDSYESISWTPIKELNIAAEGKQYLIGHRYRAKNSFGGYVIEEKLFYLDSIGNILDVIDIQAD